jgi:K+-sensing histidine kinase KdpD
LLWAFVPIRLHLPNIDVALVLVVVVMALGTSGRHWVPIVAAVTAAIAFEFFDTKPFEQLAIARNPDVWTTVLLAAVGALAGECVVRLTRQRASIRAGHADMRRVRSASDLVASGEEAELIVQRIAQELEQLLQLKQCRFEAMPSQPGAPEVHRDGTVATSSPAALGASTIAPVPWAELPVWGQGQVLGHFVWAFKPENPATQDQLRVAVTLADQVGAALTAYSSPGPPLPDEGGRPTGPLRVVR